MEKIVDHRKRGEMVMSMKGLFKVWYSQERMSIMKTGKKETWVR